RPPLLPYATLFRSIAVESFSARAGYGGDHASVRINLADAIVPGVSDQHITISQYRQRVRPVQQGVGRGTAVARVALVSIARHSREKPLSIHFAEAITKHFNHVHVPLSVEID